jgi:hypothetical protein
MLIRFAPLLLLLLATAAAADTATDPRYPFRTDFANADLPWYKPKPLEFPPHHSDRRISGELVSADYIHRTGQFRASKSGELMDFTMPPYGAVNYLNTEADLRDVPLGTFFLFFLNQDEDGNFTRLATMQDQYTMDAGHSFTYRLDEIHLSEGKLLTMKHSLPKKQENLGSKELFVRPTTRVWRDGKSISLSDLKVGDELLFNITGKNATSPGVCTDIWAGLETHTQTTAKQRDKFAAFTKVRGIPGWIEKTQGNEVTVTLFSGDTKNFAATYMKDFEVGKSGKLAVANDETRTWNPPVDGEGASFVSIEKVPQDGYGCSGVCMTLRVSNMLEGFRRGRVIRLYGSGWKTQDMFYGESLMGYGFGRMLDQELVENPAKEYPDQFPFRTDFGNRDLSWFQPKPGEKPPPFSEHVVFGELIQADSATRSGQFKTDRTGDLVNFTMLAEGSAKYLTAEVPLSDIPLGTRCRFHLYQDDKGSFTKALLVTDEFSHMDANAITWRIESLDAAAGKLVAAWQLPKVKDYNGDMQQPQDIGHQTVAISKDTKVWKDGKPAPIADVAIGDLFRPRLSAEKPGDPSRCLELWIGEDYLQKIAEDQRAKYKPAAQAKR